MEARCASCGSAVRAGGYEVQRLISRTPHSRVYLARSPMGQEVALKELLFAQVPGTPELEAFEREARLLETLSHPRIPRLLGHFQEGEGAALRLYVAEQYIAGETLLARLEHHTFSDDEARDLALQVLEILEYLHGRVPPVLHRDIKPANLIRQPDGALFLVDFGSAREAARGSTLGSTLVGTFGYMPLEQFGGTVDVTSDLYALGATLVHLLGRSPPADHFQPSRGLDLGHLGASSLLPWLRKVTALHPEERYASATLARRALEEFQSGSRSADPMASSARQAEAGESRERASRGVRYEEDRLALMDFYRMVCPRFLAPAVLPWTGLLVAIALYTCLAAIDVQRLPALDTPAGAGLVLALIGGACGVLASPFLLQALRCKWRFQRLPFALEGLGSLIHRGRGDFRTFIRCTLRLRMKEPDRTLSASTLRTARDTALQVFIDRANGAISRMAGHSEFFQKLHWSRQGDFAQGHANGRIAGLLLAICIESLAPLHRELGSIESVAIESSDEQFFLPYGDS